jgi:phosphohistidine phosphatase
MELYFLRHAIAVKRGSPGFEEDDSARPLTAQGREKMLGNAQGMNALNLSFDVILSSRYLRAKETAQIVSGVFKLKKSQTIFTENLIPGASFEQLIDEINAHAKKFKSILLIGHEPHLSELMSFLLTGGRQIPIALKKGGICKLSILKLCSTSSASLDWLLTPSQLRLLAAPNP